MQASLFQKKIHGYLLLVALIVISSKLSGQGANGVRSTARPNILIILTDDMKWNSISLLNPDNILQTPNIDRIGLEGARINYYSTNALCVPGRTALMSGKYGHITSALNNRHPVPDSLILLPKILHDHGYFTAQCGKWMINHTDPYKPYFDYWLSTKDKVAYFNDTCQYFNTYFESTEHMTDLLTDTAIQLISRMDTPFFMMLNHNAPHREWFCQPEYDSAFVNDVFAVPENFNRYTANFPSFMNDTNFHFVSGYSDEEFKLQKYYRMMAGIEASVGEVLNALTTRGLLDNTLVIFTTDNSYLIGEHGLREKQFPYEECMKMPLLIRYPPLFQPNTLVDNNFILNIDIAPTILSLLGISDTFEMQGTPIQQFISGQKSRSEFLYEQKPGTDTLPNERTFRDEKFQYNRYYCMDTTEELFDMQHDPFQKINLVNDNAHFSILHHYRFKLDRIREALNDTAVFDLCSCYLTNKQYTSDILSDSSATTTGVIDLYPNPIIDFFTLHAKISATATIDLYNIIGQQLKSFQADFTHSEWQNFSVVDIPTGIYFLNIRSSNKNFTAKFVKY